MNRAMLLDMTSTDYDDDSVLEVIDLEKNTGIYTTNFDMTSLSALIYTSRVKRSKSICSYDSTIQDEGEENRLTLAYERLHTVPKTLVDRFGSTIEILDISHNRIKNVDFLSRFKSLTSLIADNNLISENTTFPAMPKLELLWLNHCKVEKLFPWMRKLRQSCPNLKHICLMGNPAAPSYLNGGTFYEYLQYRLFVISLFPLLVHLDDRAVTEDQRTEAKRLYKRPLLERLTTFANSDLVVSSNALLHWRMLHNKMAGLFDPSTCSPNKNRNVFV